MTQSEKIDLLKPAIVFLYEKEGRSKSYISRLLEVDRKTLIKKINEWGLEKANVSYMTPSTEKFLNKHKKLIISRLNNDVTIVDIAKELNVGTKVIYNLLDKDKELAHYHNESKKRSEKRHIERVESLKENSKFIYDFDDLEGEEWKSILGYEKYFISNMGRVKKYAERYDAFFLIQPHLGGPNQNRLYVGIQEKNFQVARLVGFAFVGGYSEEKNTINHIDKDTTNNKATNLEWLSQAENNKHAYDTGRNKVMPYQKHGKFKKIILNDKYEFKTITALAKFCGVSVTQMYRYIDGECKCDYKIEFIY